MRADYITIDHNEVADCAWYSPYGNSGISTYQDWNTDNNTGYKMFITNNIVHGNRNYISWQQVGTITDGEGIIVDDGRNTQLGSTNGVYNGRTLVANNVAYGNGSAGIWAYSSNHVDFINNTTFDNEQTDNLDNGQLGVSSASDIRFINNIFYSQPGKKTLNVWAVDNLVWSHNIYFGGTNAAVMGPGDQVTDPYLVNPSLDPRSANFHLQFGSQAIGNGEADIAPQTDIDGNPRPGPYGVDIGAYQFKG
ncbi:MAG: hypothetical protein JOZ78_06870 [Chroococcidiopsidaceae cyanobacterium CP_BM_ER_R8_30]|nr:hypothetical protein [Chroococcidiopsidaceae cyanobacterium CP_BM_ER_R8_30]